MICQAHNCDTPLTGQSIKFCSRQCMYRSRDRRRNSQRRYGLSREVYDQIMAATTRCPLCLKIAPLVMDHQHNTRVIRGAICQACNFTVGHIEHCDPETLTRILRWVGLVGATDATQATRPLESTI